VGVVGAVVLALTAGDVAGVSLTIVYALIPLPLLWLLFRWLDQYEPEPRRYVWAAFIWGGVVAVALAVGLETFASEVMGLSENQMATFAAPLAEEPAKCLFLALTMLRARKVIDGVLDGILYAGLVGVGFAFVENLLYYSSIYSTSELEIAGAEGTTLTFIVRGLASPFAHPLFTAGFGIALGLTLITRSRLLRVVLLVMGLATSIALHGLWNGSLSYDASGMAFMLVYMALGMALIAVLVTAFILRARESQVLRQSLEHMAYRGWIHPDEVPYLADLGYRKAAQRYAAQNYGKQAAQTVRAYQRLATEAGFAHHALMCQRTRLGGVDRVYALMDHMYALRPALRLPPPIARTGHWAAV
jgi:RsiW-degrading membrane proteinase PrsW (M82 family)